MSHCCTTEHSRHDFPPAHCRPRCADYDRTHPETHLVDDGEELAAGLGVDTLLDAAVAGHQVVHLGLALLGAAAVALKQNTETRQNVTPKTPATKMFSEAPLGSSKIGLCFPVCCNCRWYALMFPEAPGFS